MQIRLRNIGKTAELAAFLRRMGCGVDLVRPGLVAASVPEPHVASVAEVELDAYLRVWAALHPDAPAELLFREGRAPAV